MSSSNRARSVMAGLVAFLVLVALAGTATSQGNSPADAMTDLVDEAVVTAWDQEAATKLATELERILDKGYAQSLKAPPQATVLQQRERDAAQSVIRRSRDLGREYAQQMRAGSDRDTSERFFRTVVDEVEYLWDTAGDAVPAEDAQPMIRQIRSILEDLEARYAAL